MRFYAFFICLFMGFLSIQAPHVAWALDTAPTGYVDASTLPPQLLPPPPAEGSKAWSAQIDTVLKAQKSLSVSEHAAMKAEQGVHIEMMTTLLGPSFTRQRLPKTFAMLDRVMDSTHKIVDADKQFWHTRRPYLTDSRVQLYVDPIDDSPSYPSGHTTASRVLAEVLGMLVPDKVSALRARADSIARHRVEAGVHYPVDLDAGRSLAMLITGALAGNDDFQDDLAVAQKEIAGK